mgnify:CR=1 FL=1
MANPIQTIEGGAALIKILKGILQQRSATTGTLKASDAAKAAAKGVEQKSPVNTNIFENVQQGASPAPKYSPEEIAAAKAASDAANMKAQKATEVRDAEHLTSGNTPSPGTNLVEDAGEARIVNRERTKSGVAADKKMDYQAQKDLNEEQFLTGGHDPKVTQIPPNKLDEGSKGKNARIKQGANISGNRGPQISGQSNSFFDNLDLIRRQPAKGKTYPSSSSALPKKFENKEETFTTYNEATGEWTKKKYAPSNAALGREAKKSRTDNFFDAIEAKAEKLFKSVERHTNPNPKIEGTTGNALKQNQYQSGTKSVEEFNPTDIHGNSQVDDPKKSFDLLGHGQELGIIRAKNNISNPDSDYSIVPHWRDIQERIASLETMINKLTRQGDKTGVAKYNSGERIPQNLADRKAITAAREDKFGDIYSNPDATGGKSEKLDLGHGGATPYSLQHIRKEIATLTKEREMFEAHLRQRGVMPGLDSVEGLPDDVIRDFNLEALVPEYREIGNPRVLEEEAIYSIDDLLQKYNKD